MSETESRLRRGDLDATDGKVERRNTRRSMFRSHGFEIAFAVTSVMIAVQFIADPDVRQQTAVGALGSSLAWEWTFFYLFGGLGMLYGLFRPDDRWEIIGLIFFSSASIVNAASLFQVRGTRAAYVALIFVAFIAGSISRILLLVRLRQANKRVPSRVEE